MTTRRGFLIGAGATALALSGLLYFIKRHEWGRAPISGTIPGFGPLAPDPGEVIDLPEGFSYSIVSRAGDIMIDGLPTPGRQDGMACFPHTEDEVLLVCNHELGDWPAAREVSPFGPGDKLFHLVHEDKVYDHGLPDARVIGGTTTMLYNVKEGRLVHQFLSLAGTQVNCAGGLTPWGSWLSCEEFFDGPRGAMQQRHGYVFEVPASATPGLVEPIPLKDMGRFVHEAACVDHKTGIVYMTQDAVESCLYRFIPDQPSNLKAGGALEALVIKDRPSARTDNHRRWGGDTIPENQPLKVSWIPLENVDYDENDLAERAIALGAANFSRGEGMWFGSDEFYFSSTDGGPERKGQVWRFDTRAETLELFIQPGNAALMENLDNLTIAPWGDLIICEDGPIPNYLRGITPEGEIYNIARGDYYRSEFAGACFSPDGRVLFVNLQDAHMTLAITGPWRRLQNT